MKRAYAMGAVALLLVVNLVLFGLTATAQTSTGTCVGVGVASPTEKLEVDGNIKAKQVIATEKVVVQTSNGMVPIGVQCNWNGTWGYNDDGSGNDFGVVCKDNKYIVAYCQMSGFGRGLNNGNFACYTP